MPKLRCPARLGRRRPKLARMPKRDCRLGSEGALQRMQAAAGLAAPQAAAVTTLASAPFSSSSGSRRASSVASAAALASPTQRIPCDRNLPLIPAGLGPVLE